MPQVVQQEHHQTEWPSGPVPALLPRFLISDFTQLLRPKWCDPASVRKSPSIGRWVGRSVGACCPVGPFNNLSRRRPFPRCGFRAGGKDQSARAERQRRRGGQCNPPSFLPSFSPSFFMRSTVVPDDDDDDAGDRPTCGLFVMFHGDDREGGREERGRRRGDHGNIYSMYDSVVVAAAVGRKRGIHKIKLNFNSKWFWPGLTRRRGV